jgi:hypothetical protein
MIKIVESEIVKLFKLLKVDESLGEMMSDIKKETLLNFKEGMLAKEADAMENLEEIKEDERLMKAFETASSKILVRYYADHKKGYSEEQKEIFLTFLLTNKIKRSLESSS